MSDIVTFPLRCQITSSVGHGIRDAIVYAVGASPPGAMAQFTDYGSGEIEWVPFVDHHGHACRTIRPLPDDVGAINPIQGAAREKQQRRFIIGDCVTFDGRKAVVQSRHNVDSAWIRFTADGTAAKVRTDLLELRDCEPEDRISHETDESLREQSDLRQRPAEF